ncbi:MAG: hypothetical protein JNK30_09090 [Phenylobacterium sp.]|nr:hypothetical protein [Phenylobacterium sp.]
MPSISVGAAMAVAENIMNITGPCRRSLWRHVSPGQTSGRSAGCQGARGQISPSGPRTLPGQAQLQAQEKCHQRLTPRSSAPGQAHPKTVAIMPWRRP